MGEKIPTVLYFVLCYDSSTKTSFGHHMQSNREKGKTLQTHWSDVTHVTLDSAFFHCMLSNSNSKTEAVK